MSELTCKYVAFKKMLVVSVSLIFSGVYANNFMEELAPSNVNIDELSEAQGKCFRHIMCDMKLPLEIKKSVDAVHDKEIHYILDTYAEHFPEYIQKLMTFENFRDDKFWIESIQPMICQHIEEDFEMEFMKREGLRYYSHLNDICDYPTAEEVCETLMMCNIIYNEMLGRMIEAEECEIPVYQDPKKMMQLD